MRWTFSKKYFAENAQQQMKTVDKKRETWYINWKKQKHGNMVSLMRSLWREKTFTMP